MTATSLQETVTAGDLSTILHAQRAAFRREGPPSAEVRRNRLDRLLVAVLGAADDLVAALETDFGHRPPAFSYLTDIMSVVPNILHLQDQLDGWMEPTEVAGSVEAGMPTTIDVAPLGVVGVIGPWNFPVALVVQPAAEAIAAGNRVMIKFSDVDSRTGEVLARAVAEEFDPEELVVINGDLEVAQAFSALPFDHLFFTGSPAVGRAVQRAAADNLTPVTLELGGKNPVVVGRDADITVAAERIAISRTINGGQLCLCPDYVFVPRASLDFFLDETAAAFRRLYPEYTTDSAVTTIVNARNYERVTGLVRDAVNQGATAILCVDEAVTELLPDPDTRRIAPTLLLGVTEQMAVAHNEVFGPVLTVYPYDDVTEPIDYITAHPSPLVAYWYGDDSSDFGEFRRRTASGGITRNDFAVHLSLPDVPFGGVGQSGMGTYHGRAGFETFSHRRAVAESRIPGGMTGFMSPTVLTDETAQAMQAASAQAHQAAMERLGR